MSRAKSTPRQILTPEDAEQYLRETSIAGVSNMEDCLMWGCLVEAWRLRASSADDLAAHLDMTPEELRRLLRLDSSLALAAPYDHRPLLVKLGILDADKVKEEKVPTFDLLVAATGERPEKLLRRGYLRIEPFLFADMEEDLETFFNEDGTPIEYDSPYSEPPACSDLAMHRYLAMKKRQGGEPAPQAAHAEFCRNPPWSWRYPFAFSVFHMFPGQLPLQVKVGWREYVRWAWLDVRGCYRGVRSWWSWYWEDELSLKVTLCWEGFKFICWRLADRVYFQLWASLAALRWLAGGRRDRRILPWRGDVVAIRDHRIEAHVVVTRRGLRRVFFEPKADASDDDVADLRDLVTWNSGQDDVHQGLTISMWRSLATRPRTAMHDLSREQRLEQERQLRSGMGPSPFIPAG